MYNEIKKNYNYLTCGIGKQCTWNRKIILKIGQREYIFQNIKSQKYEGKKAESKEQNNV